MNHFLSEFQFSSKACQLIAAIERKKYTIGKKCSKKMLGILVTSYRIIEDVSDGSSHFIQALGFVSEKVAQGEPLSESGIQRVHAIVTGAGTFRSYYRRSQNVIYEADMTTISYLPPKASDVKRLVVELIVWLDSHAHYCAEVKAAIAHYALNAIHPFYDGNGRVARLVSRWLLGLGGFGENYCLETYYAKDLGRYYTQLGIASSDINAWLEYFLEGVYKVL